VLSSGGICGTCDQVGYLAKNAEVFTLPYLFKNDGSGELASRPVITDAPGTVGYWTSFQIARPNAAFDPEGRADPAGVANALGPDGATLCPAPLYGRRRLAHGRRARVHEHRRPGVYMLFIVDSSGVPSVARMVQLDPAAPPPPHPPPPPPPPRNQLPSVSLTSPANNARFTSPAKVSLAATASDPDGTVIRVEFFNGATKVGEDTTAPYTGQWNTGAAGTYTLTARATDNAGATTPSSPVTIIVAKKR
jgi:hypothetical protein